MLEINGDKTQLAAYLAMAMVGWREEMDLSWWVEDKVPRLPRECKVILGNLDALLVEGRKAAQASRSSGAARIIFGYNMRQRQLADIDRGAGKQSFKSSCWTAWGVLVCPKLQD